MSRILRPILEKAEAKSGTGGVARERLQILIAQQRSGSAFDGVNLRAMQMELFECVKVGKDLN